MFLKRTLSFIIDFLTVLPFCMILTVFFLIKSGMCEDIGLAIFTTVFLYINPFLITNMPLEAIPTMIFCYAFSAITMYCIYCLVAELCFKTTIGQKTQGIIYLDNQKNHLSNRQIIERNILKYVCLVLVLIAFVSIPFSKKHKPLYDILLKIDITKNE